MPACANNKEWCKGLTGVVSLLGFLVVVLSILATSQAARINKLEDRGDTIVELKTDMNYVKSDLREIKNMLQVKHP